MITGLDHVLLAIPPGEEERARAFYTGVLELREVPKPAKLADRGGCWFEGARAYIHLGIDPDCAPGKKAHVAFTVRNLDTLKDRLMAAGYEVIPDSAVDGVTRFYVFDPFGNRLEFIQDGQGFSQQSKA